MSISIWPNEEDYQFFIQWYFTSSTAIYFHKRNLYRAKIGMSQLEIPKWERFIINLGIFGKHIHIELNYKRVAPLPIKK